jgi:aspartyl-tRNA(Asn)/glutamyl-tRNA(Gln) amidotransferase subunit B
VAEARVGSPRELGLSPERLGLLIDLVQDETLSKSGAKAVLRAMLEDPRPPAELVAELGLAQVNDPERIEAWCREALEGQERAVADVRHGELKALGALIGRAMKASGGKANPERVRATLLGWLVAAPRGDEA